MRTAAPAKRKSEDEPEGASSSKQRKIESFTKSELSDARRAYGTYAKNKKPLLDFNTFVYTLPTETFTDYWFYERDLRQAMPFIRAAEGTCNYFQRIVRETCR